MKQFWSGWLVIGGLALLLAACSAGTPAPISSPSPVPTQTLAVRPTASDVPTPARPPGLVVWVPPQLDPSESTHASELLKSRLEVFRLENPGVPVTLRVKPASGSGNLLDALTITAAAAPANLPSLVALPRADLETAALKSLIYPYDGLTRAADDPDWYASARQLALIQGSIYSLPYGAEIMLLVNRPARGGPIPVDWATLLKAGAPLSFAAADPQGIGTLLLYLSAGGTIRDAQGRPALQADVLVKVLRLYADGVKAGVMQSWLAQTQSDSQAWQAYREGRAQWMMGWSSRYLADLPLDSSAGAIPSLGQQPLTLATGWGWALSEPHLERRATAARLAESLVGSDFLSQFSAALGYLPPRPSALAAWSNQNLKSVLSPLVLSAQVKPANDLLATLGPVLQEATLAVLRQQADPTQAAQAAVERLATPPAR